MEKIATDFKLCIAKYLQMQEEVKQLLCLLTKDNPKTTAELCDLLLDHISIPLRSQGASPDLVYTVRPEINLLATMLQKDDSCWEQKAKWVYYFG